MALLTVVSLPASLPPSGQPGDKTQDALGDPGPRTVVTRIALDRLPVLTAALVYYYYYYFLFSSQASEPASQPASQPAFPSPPPAPGLRMIGAPGCRGGEILVASRFIFAARMHGEAI